MERYRGQFVVLKFGGHATALDAFARDLARLSAAGALPVVVHGGGPQIDEMAKRLGLSSRFEGGLRVTDEAMLEVVQMVLARVGTSIVSALERAGVEALSLSGQDARALTATRKTQPDLGLVGTDVRVNAVPLALLAENGIVPVVAPVASDGRGGALNVNADEAAGAIAGGLSAAALLLLSNVEGVLVDGKPQASLPPSRARALLSDGRATAGMIPKIESALAAAEQGVELVRIGSLAEPGAPGATLEALLSPASQAGTRVGGA